MGFASLSNFQILIDTNFLTTFQYWDSNGQLQDSIGKYTIPRKYLNGDTIFQTQVSSSGYRNIVDIDVGYNPIWIYRAYCATCTGHIVPLKTDLISRPNLHINL
jgi:hypothetical protein